MRGWTNPTCAWRSTNFAAPDCRCWSTPKLPAPLKPRLQRSTSRCELAQIFHLSCLASRRGRGRCHQAADPAGPRISDSDPRRAPLQRQGIADPGRSARPRRAHHGGDLRTLPLVYSEQIPDGATEFKCAPPIRDQANREQLWAALESGLIDLVATDHSPCPPAMKRREEGRWDLAWGGIASLGLALPVMWTAMRQRGKIQRTAERIGRWMAARPARLAGLTGRKGRSIPEPTRISSVFDPDAAWTVTEDDLHFRHKISPYLGASCGGACRKRGCAASKFLPTGNSPASRAAESWCASERSRQTSHRRMPSHRPNERRAWPHHAPLPHGAGSPGSPASARSHGEPGHDRARGCRRQSARALEIQAAQAASGSSSAPTSIPCPTPVPSTACSALFSRLSWSSPQSVLYYPCPLKSSHSLKKKVCVSESPSSAAAQLPDDSIRHCSRSKMPMESQFGRQFETLGSIRKSSKTRLPMTSRRLCRDSH